MLKTRQGVTVSEGKTRRFLRMPQVIDKTGLPAATVYKHMAAGTFPRSIPLGPKIRAFLEEEVEAWMDARIAEREVPR